MEAHFGAVLRHLSGYRLEGCIEVVGVPQKRGSQLEAIRAAIEYADRGEV